MLKKQTVWLLTMLSLVVVLSVYYITSPEGGSSPDVVLTDTETNSNEKESGNDNNKEQTEQQKTDAKQQEKEQSSKQSSSEDGSVVSTITDDDLFTALRMEVEDERSERKQELETIIGSNDVSSEEKNNAYEEMRELSKLSEKEKVLETLIKTKGYEDALVRADGDKVRITVKAKEHSPQQANELIQLVKDEIQSMQDVAVTFEIAK
ncbi:MAG: SpoIIIAH-like family protein [Bacillaceae bacterium]|mgnify:FL=1|jgi:stage III sporulation protein AH|uniref:SpoIIIAH-like family protein n=1 Tax=Aeribacillus composti TaxID=1868734 RepID=A0ABY9WFF4_9BACI|nr:MULTISPECIES: SpoIIIAH-like family protein [Aeribacillus]AXI40108.1 SpoIIIAH-like family protein [Bacillaceae bacterium ZC4]REJ18541.1 MAG: SpoIIIAH-like family protein [Bacillaceae bacterium]KZM56832.1 hypothetical protein A3Q35_07255 [Aeribacillus pallidus]MDR9792778.1 SpoIIIAH-like family protein [Aeribacillus pallidus]MDR9795713.1 SpoIIIAH-like family protein [Aeribacillus pallidus]